MATSLACKLLSVSHQPQPKQFPFPLSVQMYNLPWTIFTVVQTLRKTAFNNFYPLILNISHHNPITAIRLAVAAAAANILPRKQHEKIKRGTKISEKFVFFCVLQAQTEELSVFKKCNTVVIYKSSSLLAVNKLRKESLGKYNLFMFCMCVCVCYVGCAALAGLAGHRLCSWQDLCCCSYTSVYHECRQQ